MPIFSLVQCSFDRHRFLYIMSIYLSFYSSTIYIILSTNLSIYPGFYWLSCTSWSPSKAPVLQKTFFKNQVGKSTRIILMMLNNYMTQLFFIALYIWPDLYLARYASGKNVSGLEKGLYLGRYNKSGQKRGMRNRPQGSHQILLY